MATPAKSIQARDVETVVEMYQQMGIPAWAIRHGPAQPGKYTGDDIAEGEEKLAWWLKKLEESESAAIYTLCVFENPGKGIKDNTPADCSFNFRFHDDTRNYLPGEQYAGSYGALVGMVGEIAKEVKLLKEKKPEEPSQLGMIGEIMEMEAFAPILMAVGTRIADFIMPEKEGLKRVSGIPGLGSEDSSVGNPLTSGAWREDPVLTGAIDRLSKCVEDLPLLMTKLANMAENSPGNFKFYSNMLRKIK